MITSPTLPSHSIWTDTVALVERTLTEAQRSDFFDALIRDIQRNESQEALECLVQLTMREDVGADACRALTTLQRDAFYCVPAHDPERPRRLQQQLRAFAFDAYHLANRSQATPHASAFKVADLPVHVLHLAGSHARAQGWEREVDNIRNVMATRFPPSEGGGTLLRVDRGVTSDELHLKAGATYGRLKPHAGLVEIHGKTVFLQGKPVDGLTETLFKDIQPGEARPVSLWLDGHYLHGLCTLEEGKRTLSLLDSAPLENDGRDAAIQAALPGVDTLNVHGQQLQEGLPQACGAFGELLFDFCGREREADGATIVEFARRFSNASLEQRQLALDGARADLLDSWARHRQSGGATQPPHGA